MIPSEFKMFLSYISQTEEEEEQQQRNILDAAEIRNRIATMARQGDQIVDINHEEFDQFKTDILRPYYSVLTLLHR